jgi:hypothetical protein
MFATVNRSSIVSAATPGPVISTIELLTSPPSVREASVEANAHRRRNLPPEVAGRPDPHCIRTNHRRPERTQRAIHVRVRIRGHAEGARGHAEGARNHEAILDHDLVADPAATGPEVDALRLGERRDLPPDLEAVAVGVLDVVIQGDQELPRVTDQPGASLPEAIEDGRAVVVSEELPRAKRDRVPRPRRPVRSRNSVPARDLFGKSLTTHSASNPAQNTRAPRPATRAAKS